MARVLLISVSLEDPSGDIGRQQASHSGNGVESESDFITRYFQSAFLLFNESARKDTFGVHTLAENPEEADIIIFVETIGHGMFAERVRHHPYLKMYREKCFLFDPGDYALPFLPGLYASHRKRYHDLARTRTGFYLRITESPYVTFRPAQPDYRYLATFMGSFDSHPCRSELARLPGDRFLIEDTSAFSARLQSIAKGEEEEREQFLFKYAEAIAAAPFALCPRGRGPGSIRLFEVMQMGRVPVIISDEWVYPHRVDWRACSVIVPEREINRIPEILEKYRPHAVEMGLRARQEWEKYYGPSVRFHWLVEDCLELLRQRRVPEAIAARMVWRFILNYSMFRLFLSSKKQIYQQTGRILL